MRLEFQIDFLQLFVSWLEAFSMLLTIQTKNNCWWLQEFNQQWKKCRRDTRFHDVSVTENTHICEVLGNKTYFFVLKVFYRLNILSFNFKSLLFLYLSFVLITQKINLRKEKKIFSKLIRKLSLNTCIYHRYNFLYALQL